MLKTAAVTIASLLLAYPIVGMLVPLLDLQSPYVIIGALYVVAVGNAMLLVRLVA